MYRFRLLGAALLALSMASCARVPHPDATAKLDRALRDWLERPTASTRVLIRTRSDASEVITRLLGQATHSIAAPDLIVADVSADALRRAILDDNVLRVSSDAKVRSFGSALAQN